jgi:putative transposase
VSRYRFIAAEKAQHSVAQLCRVLQVAPSGFYAWRHRQPSRRALANVTLTAQIQAIHERSRSTYGRRGSTPSCRRARSASPASASLV